jgi:hypothetical protein
MHTNLLKKKKLLNSKEELDTELENNTWEEYLERFFLIEEEDFPMMGQFNNNHLQETKLKLIKRGGNDDN